MAIIKPFKALRPHKEYAAQVASKPYDVLNSEEARKEAGSNLLSFLHITKAEIDLPADTDIHGDAVYQRAKENLQQFIDRHILFFEEYPCYYIYELGWKGRTQTGLVCASSLEDYFNDVIKKHEFTRPEKEKDRIDHMLSTRAQTGNVFLACKNLKELNDVFDHWKHDNNAEYSFTAEDGVTHTLWVVDSPATIDVITSLFKEKVPFTYIADGHHRAASAAKVSQALTGNEDARYFLTTIFPANQLAIMDYNRLVKDLKCPVNILVGPGSPSVAELEALGVARRSVGSAIMRASLGVARRAAEELMASGTYASLEGGIPHDEVNKLLGR